jgi:dihydrodipicolinate synthase/N-acetylneuraminate lyase
MKTRQELLSFFFDGKLPRLLCPPLTHYTSTGELDSDRMTAHWKWMKQHVNGFLVPGTTGDGWELSPAETSQLLDFSITLAKEIDVFLLFGVMKSTGDEMVSSIKEFQHMLQLKTGQSDILQAMKESKIYGITVCPPKGSYLSQQEIGQALSEVLEFGLPTTIYQLPQITENEISSDLFLQLAGDYANFIMVKDTSGKDKIALEASSHGIYLVRGAEGNYVNWLKESGGPYDGFLLSSANCFSLYLKKMIEMLEVGESALAGDMSNKLTMIFNDVFQLVKDLPYGNPFTNTNKAIDFFLAYGQEADKMGLPRLHSGNQLPMNIMVKTRDILKARSLLPKNGYMNILNLF